MESFGSLKNNAFGDFNKEDVLGFIDEMTNKTKKAELVLKDRVGSLSRDRAHLAAKISSFEAMITGLEKHLEEERENVQCALAERDELQKKIQVERDSFDSLLAKRQRELAESEREILEFAEQKKKMDQRMSELETKSRRYDDIKANIGAIRLDAEMEAIKTTEDAQEKAMDAVSVIEDVSAELENMRRQMNAVKDEFHAMDAPLTSEEPVPPAPEKTEAAESDEPEKAASAQPGSDSLERLDALYRALDQSMEKLQDIKTHFIAKNQAPSE